MNTPVHPLVLIADDHPLYCDALRAIVPQACPGAEISEANSQAEVLAAVSAVAAVDAERRFDLVLLDLNLPGARGLSCLEALKKLAPGTPIVVVSAVDDPRIMHDVIMGGANAFVPKSASGQVLINALRAILAGGTYMPAGVLAAMRLTDGATAGGTGGGPGGSPGRDELTLRQRRVLELLATGLSNKHIARALEISEITVKAHVSAIFRKLGVTNRVQAGLEARKFRGGTLGGA
jgi:DNA-binding NarL/FixJ family response regulator